MNKRNSMRSSTEMEKPKQKKSKGTSTRGAPLYPRSKKKAPSQTTTPPVSNRKHKNRQYITRSKYELITKPPEQSPDLELPTFSSNVTIGDFLRNLNLYPCRKPLKSTLVSNSSSNEGEASPSKIAKTTDNSHTNTKVQEIPSVIEMDDYNIIKDAETARSEMTWESEQLTMTPESKMTTTEKESTMPEEPSGNLSIPIKYELIHNYSKFPVILNLLGAEPSQSNHSRNSPATKPCNSPRPIRQSDPIRESDNPQSSSTTKPRISPRPIRQSDPIRESDNSQSSPTNKPCISYRPISQSDNSQSSPTSKPCISPRPIRQPDNSQSSPTNKPCISPRPISQSSNSQSSPTNKPCDSPRPISQSDPIEQSNISQISPTNKPFDSSRTPIDKIEATVTSNSIQNDGLKSIGDKEKRIPPKASKSTNAGFITPLGKLLITPKSKVKPNAFPALEEMITASKTPGSVLHSILEQLKEMAKEEESTNVEAEASKEPEKLANHTVDQPLSPVKVEAVRSIPIDSNSIGNHCTDLNVPTSPIKEHVVQPSPIKEDMVPTLLIKEDVVLTSSIKKHVVQPSPIKEHVVQPSPIKEDMVPTLPIKEDVVQPSPIKEDVVPPSAIKKNVVQPSPIKEDMVPTLPIKEDVVLTSSLKKHVVQPSFIKEGVVPTLSIKENVLPPSPNKEDVVPPSPIKKDVVPPSPIKEVVVPPSPIKEDVVTPAPIKEDEVQSSPIKEDVVPPSAIKENVVSSSSIKEHLVPTSSFKEHQVHPSPIKEDVVTPSPTKEDLVPPSPIKEDVVPPSPIKEHVVTSLSIKENVVHPSSIKAVMVSPSPIKEDVVPPSAIKENVIPTSPIEEHAVNTQKAPVNKPNPGVEAPKCVKINFKSLSTNVQDLNSNKFPTSEKTERTETQALLNNPIEIDQAEDSPNLEVMEETATQALPTNSRPQHIEDDDYTIINLEVEATSDPIENLGETSVEVENEPVSTSLEETSPNLDEPEKVFDPSIEINQAGDSLNLEIREKDTTEAVPTGSRPDDYGKSYVEDDYTIVKLEGEATSYPIEIFGETFIVVKNAEDDLTSQNDANTEEQLKLETTESCADVSTCNNDQQHTSTYQSSGVSENVADNKDQGLNTDQTSADHNKSERNLFSVFNLLPSPMTTIKQHLGSFTDDSQADSDQEIWPEDRLKGSPEDIKIAFQTLISEVETLGPNVFINSKNLFQGRAQDDPNCPKPVLCPLCNIPFQFSSHVREHVTCHFEAKPFKCPYCPKSFRRKNGGLNKHLLTHTNELSHICKICKKGFSQKSYLDQHQTCHIDDKPFNCDLCGRAFKKKCHVRAHKMCFHTDYKPFICSICGKRYKLNNHLVQHMKTHTDERNYSCAHCSKTFQAVVILKRHMKLHSGEKPFECDVCGKSFVERGNLVRHLRRVCKRKMEDRKFKCEYCDKRFLQRIHRTEHMRIHTDEIPFWCTLCGKGFKTSGNRKAHYTWHVKKQDIDNVKVLEETDALIDAKNRDLKNKDTGMQLPTRPRECNIMVSSKNSKDDDNDDDADDNDDDDDDADDNDDDDYDENNDNDDDDDDDDQE